MTLPWNRIDPNDIDAKEKRSLWTWVYVLTRLFMLTTVAGLLVGWVEDGGEGVLIGALVFLGVATFLTAFAFLIWVIGTTD